jgi:cellulose synthase/poly-beta-1,6-N-acetylglucosamine synthase-like glycosyltransferase
LKGEIYPSVTVLLTVHNEEDLIEKRVLNILDADYPADKLEVLVASDGSTDRTDEIVENIRRKDERVRLFSTDGGGKSVTQNLAIPHAKGEIIVLTDAETKFDNNAVRKIVSNFNDDSVGCASGRLLLVKSGSSISESQGMYWKYETIMRRLESRLGTMHTASGQIMAFRKTRFRPFECEFGDDCIIPLDMLCQGFKVVHDDDAIAFDIFPSSIKSELRARVRMTLKNITCTLSRYELLNPLDRPLISISILSHKLLRWLTPYLMLTLLISNYFLFGYGLIYQLIFMSQLFFYSCAIAGYFAEKNQFRLPVASQVFSFMLANIGFFIGVLKAICGEKIFAYKN